MNCKIQTRQKENPFASDVENYKKKYRNFKPSLCNPFTISILYPGVSNRNFSWGRDGGGLAKILL